jgi:hypothetical protein
VPSLAPALRAGALDIPQTRKQRNLLLDMIFVRNVSVHELDLQQQQLLVHEAFVVQLLIGQIRNRLEDELDACYRQRDRRAQ